MLIVILLPLLFHSAASKMVSNLELQKQLYETSLNSSIFMDKEDKGLRNTWTVDFQVKRVNVMTKYRMQMNKHMEHNFRRTENAKWTECLFLHRKQIRKSEKQYYADEAECLTTTTAEGTEKTKAVEQLEREDLSKKLQKQLWNLEDSTLKKVNPHSASRKWRKSYRYLVNTCNTTNPGNDEASTLCLVQNMEEDNYHKVIQRLMILKLEAMGELFIQLNDSLYNFEECLKTQLLIYLEKIREILDTLYKCYSLTTQSEIEETN